MLFNLVEYLAGQLPNINFEANGFTPDSNQDQIMLSETGGEPEHWYDRTDWTVQVLSRGIDKVVAKQNIDSVYSILKNKFGLVLPEVTVNAVVYPAVTAWQISPIQTPAYLGATVENLEMFSFNLTITTY